MKKLIALILTVIIVSGTISVYANDGQNIFEWLKNQPDITENAVEFTDVAKTDWFYKNLNTMAEIGYITGYEDGTFRPNEPVTKAEFITILLRAANNDSNYTVLTDHWAQSFVNKANEIGWFEDDYIRIDQYDEPMDRLNATIITLRAIKEPSGDIWAYREDSIKDFDEVPEKLQDYVLMGYYNGIIGGDADGNFKPNGTLTRAEACAIIDRAIITPESRLDPVNIGESTPGLAIKDVFSGLYANYILDENDTLWGYGSNGNGMLGIGKETCNEIFPQKIAEDVKYFTGNFTNNFIIKTNGELWGWGTNHNGELGPDAAESYYLAPVKITDNVVDVSTLKNLTLIVKENGDLIKYGTYTLDEMEKALYEGIIPEPQVISTDVKQAGLIYYANHRTMVYLKENGELWFRTLDMDTDTINEFLYKTKVRQIYANCKFFYKDYEDNMHWIYYEDEFVIPFKVADVGVGYINQVYLAEDGTAYGYGTNYGTDAQYHIANDVEKVAERLILKKDGTVYQISPVWSGSDGEMLFRKGAIFSEIILKK